MKTLFYIILILVLTSCIQDNESPKEVTTIPHISNIYILDIQVLIDGVSIDKGRYLITVNDNHISLEGQPLTQGYVSITGDNDNLYITSIYEIVTEITELAYY